MGSHKTVSGSTSPIQPTPPVADYHVIGDPVGDPDPDCKGNYFYEGEHAGYPYYRHENGQWIISASVPSERYIVSSEFDQIECNHWLKYGPEVYEITGRYFHTSCAQGFLNVVSGQE